MKFSRRMRHESYWRKRNEEINRWLDKHDVDVYKRLADIYNRGAKLTQDELFKFYGKYAKDNQISIQEAKRRLRGVDLSDYQENARRYREEAKDLSPEARENLLERLNEQYKSSQATRLDALNLDLTYQAGRLNGEIQMVFSEYLQRVASYAYRKIMGGRSASTLNAPAMKEVLSRPWNDYNYSEDLWGNTDNLARDLKETFLRGFRRGSGIDQMAQEIRKKYRVANRRAENLVRTDGSHIANSAAAKRYVDAGLKYYKDNVKVDDRTTQSVWKFIGRTKGSSYQNMSQE